MHQSRSSKSNNSRSMRPSSSGNNINFNPNDPNNININLNTGARGGAASSSSVQYDINSQNQNQMINQSQSNLQAQASSSTNLNMSNQNQMNNFNQNFNNSQSLNQNNNIPIMNQNPNNQNSNILRWQLLPNVGEIYSPRTGHVVVQSGSTFYVFGGTDGSARQADVHSYDINTNIWRNLSRSVVGTPPAARSGAQAAVIDDVVWIFGGYTKKEGEYFNDVFAFYLKELKWENVNTIGEPPCRRTDHSIALYGRSLFVFGGFDGRNRFNDLKELKLGNSGFSQNNNNNEDHHGRWCPISNRTTPPRARFGHSAVVHQSSMYIFGGWDGHCTLQELYEFHFLSNLWHQLHPRGQPPNARYRHSAVMCGHSMWIFGGVDKEQTRFQDLYELNFGSNNSNSDSISQQSAGDSKIWSRVDARCYGDNPEHYPSSRTFHRAVIYGPRMYVLGGFDGKRQNDTHVITLLNQQQYYEAQQAQLQQQMLENQQGQQQQQSNNSNSPHNDHGQNLQNLTREQQLQLQQQQQQQNFQMQQAGSGGSTGGSHTYYTSSGHSVSINTGDRTQQSEGIVQDENDVGGGQNMNNQRSSSQTQLLNNETVSSQLAQQSQNSMSMTQQQQCQLANRTSDGNTISQQHHQQLSTGSSGAPPPQEPSESNPQTRVGGVGDASEVANSLMPEDFWRWQPITNQKGQIYTARTGHAVVVYANHLYLMGGTDETARQNDIYQFNVETRTWRMLENVTGQPPSARSGSKAVVYSDSIYFFGGYTKKYGEYFHDLYRFNITYSNWTKVQAKGVIPSQRTDHSCIGLGPNLYVFGGFDGKSRFDDLQKFSIDDSTWTKINAIESSPMGRFGHTACMYNQSMYIFGGWNGHDTLDDLTEFSTSTNQWFCVPGRGDVPTSRYRHSAIVYGCCLFVFGGVDKRQARFSDLVEFNFDTRSWTKVQTFGDPPSARTFHKAVIYGGSMFILGGFDGQRRNDMYRIALIEERTKEEKLRLRGKQGPGFGMEINQPDEGFVMGDSGYDSLSQDPIDFYKLQIHEYQRRLEREEERHICKVCYEREINTVILDCRHVALCVRCARQVKDCPICRTALVQGFLETFNV